MTTTVLDAYTGAASAVVIVAAVDGADAVAV